MKRLSILAVVAAILIMVPVAAFAQTALKDWAYVDLKVQAGDTSGYKLSFNTGIALNIADHAYIIGSGESGGGTAGLYADAAYLFFSKKWFIGPVVGLLDGTTPDNTAANPTWYWINASGVLAGYGHWNIYAKYKAKLDGQARFPQGWTFGTGFHFSL